MKRQYLVVAALAAQILFAGSWWCARAGGATKQDRPRTAPHLVSEALRSEVEGNEAERDALLAAALEKKPDHAPARWHNGYVLARNRWVKYDDLDALGPRTRIKLYERARDSFAMSVEGRLALADWCKRHKLQAQQRAHLTEVLQIVPDHAEARRALGHRQIDGRWVSSEQLAENEARTQALAVAFRRWRPTLEAVREHLSSNSQRRQKEAETLLLSIDDADAIVAMEQIFALHSEKAGRLMLRALEKMPSPEASVAMARQAVYSPSPVIRSLACQMLQTREKESYVPTLLASLGSPIQSRAELYKDQAGRLTYRQMLMREGQDRNDVMVVDTPYAHTVLPPTDGQTLAAARAQLARARLEDINRRAQAMETSIGLRNQLIEAFNARVCGVLATATGEGLPAEPESWWRWWNDYNESYTTGSKPVATQYTRNTPVYTDIDVPSRPISMASLRTASPARYECLVAGTEVWTSTGVKDIDEMRVGDLVLSQHPETGELAYKPVLRTTTRGVEPLMWIETAGDAIHCTGGHPFWVAGKGWVRARDLKPAMRLHTIDGSVEVVSAEPYESEPTYNLIVADFHTYFVRESMFLTHDNTIHEPTSTAVPGLAAGAALASD